MLDTFRGLRSQYDDMQVRPVETRKLVWAWFWLKVDVDVARRVGLGLLGDDRIGMETVGKCLYRVSVVNFVASWE